jgi:hypothetical protein
VCARRWRGGLGERLVFTVDERWRHPPWHLLASHPHSASQVRCRIRAVEKDEWCADHVGARSTGPGADLLGLPWWRPVNDPQSWLDRLVATVLLRRIVTLAEQAPTLPDSELADRLQMLAGCGR